MRGHVRAAGDHWRGHLRQGLQGRGRQEPPAGGAQEREAREREGGLPDHGRARDQDPAPAPAPQHRQHDRDRDRQAGVNLWIER